jgi:fumarate hydratase class II
MTDIRKETDSLGVVEVPADKLWGAQTLNISDFQLGQEKSGNLVTQLQTGQLRRDARRSLACRRNSDSRRFVYYPRLSS